MLRAAFYRGTRPGIAGVYNWAVRAWTRSPYSHVELLFGDGMAGSASFADGGVRLKAIKFDPAHWDFVDIPAHLEPAARAWFELHDGDKYDLAGNLHFVLAPVRDNNERWFCSEAAAAALSIIEPWRYHPGTLFSALTRISTLQPASAGFLMQN
ncbi:MAG: hypothetical protein K2X55_21910 [Burkholderiaceae bacterium]|nr:hypothetical protein [Burkholderiaceae bacterium]